MTFFCFIGENSGGQIQSATLCTHMIGDDNNNQVEQNKNNKLTNLPISSNNQFKELNQY